MVILYTLFFIHFLKEEDILDYCIKNRKNVYLKLNENGAPVTCAKSVMGIFEFSKAKNVLKSLPKTLKRMNFSVVPIPEIEPKEKKILETNDYMVSDDVTRWVDKFGACSDILEEAKSREKELIDALHNIDNDILNILHSIEIEKPKDMYGGWKEYKNIKENREKRRRIKDELLIVANVLEEINPEYVKRDRIQKAINGLLNRKYKFRVVEEVE